jgi:hypothetical protein
MITAKIITKRFKTVSETTLLDEQNSIRIGTSCIDNAFIIKQAIEKRREFNLETHMAFLDLGNTFDGVNRNQL